jgi:hypothetical protein
MQRLVTPDAEDLGLGDRELVVGQGTGVVQVP